MGLIGVVVFWEERQSILAYVHTHCFKQSKNAAPRNEMFGAGVDVNVKFSSIGPTLVLRGVLRLRMMQAKCGLGG